MSQRWELEAVIITEAGREARTRLLEAGWEPFAVAEHAVWFRRPVIEPHAPLPPKPSAPRPARA